jgi:hypothetical protein
VLVLGRVELAGVDLVHKRGHGRDRSHAADG